MHRRHCRMAGHGWSDCNATQRNARQYNVVKPPAPTGQTASSTHLRVGPRHRVAQHRSFGSHRRHRALSRTPTYPLYHPQTRSNLQSNRQQQHPPVGRPTPLRCTAPRPRLRLMSACFPGGTWQPGARRRRAGAAAGGRRAAPSVAWERDKSKVGQAGASGNKTDASTA